MSKDKDAVKYPDVSASTKASEIDINSVKPNQKVYYSDETVQMTTGKIAIDIVTPEKKVYSDEVDMVSTRTIEGEIGILPRHAPLASPLQITAIRIKKDGSEKRIAVSGGFLEVRPEKITVLAETAELPEEIDIERAKTAKERAERRMAESDGDLRRAELALKRAVNRIDVAEWR